MSIYFPRIKDYFKPTKFIKLNSTLNKLHFDKLDITEEELFIFSKELEFSYTKKEKHKIGMISRNSITNLSFALGIYVENFYNDCFEDFREILIKNIKMRIAPPMVFLPIDFLKNYIDVDENILKEVLLLSVGLDLEKELLILINPTNGEYLNIPFEEINNKIFSYGNGLRWIMLNSPNMSRPKFRDKKNLMLLSLNSYGKEFLYKNNRVNPIHSYGKEALINWVESLENINKNEYEKLQRYFLRLTETPFLSYGFGREYLANCISTIEELKEYVEAIKESNKKYQIICSYILKTPYESFSKEVISDSLNEALELEAVFWSKILKIREVKND